MNNINTNMLENANIHRNSAKNRFAKLATLGETVFHIDDLANLWGISNKQTLRMTLMRYVKAENLKRIYRGLYSLKNAGEIDPYLLGIKAIHSLAYISCESILFDNGIINQPPNEISIVSQFSKHFTIGAYKYKSRQMSPDFLHNDAGIEIVNGVRTASIERAVADIYYFNPKKFLDYTSPKIINWKKVKEIIRTVGYNVKIS